MTTLANLQRSRLTIAAPVIPLLNTYDEIDLDILSDDDLETLISYDGIALGHKIRLQWFGSDAEGHPVDDINTEIEVEDSNYDPDRSTVRIDIPNVYLKALAQGYAFYSYIVVEPDLGSSLRTFCFVGVRPHRMEHMPVAQAVESHALHIDISRLPTAGVTFVVPPYQAMRTGDRVTLSFDGYDDLGDFDETWTGFIDVTSAHVGRSLTWVVPMEQLNWIEGGHAVVHYAIEFTDEPDPLQGPSQTFRIDAWPDDPAVLPALVIEGHDGGPLDPNKFPDGLTLRVDGHGDLHTADWILLHWNQQAGFMTQRADLSTLKVGKLAFQVEASALKGLETLRLSYQFAREGVGLSSRTLEKEILIPRELEHPWVTTAQAEEGENPDERYARINAADATAGAIIEVPEFPLRVGERVEVHWLGRSEAGQHVTDQPLPDQPWHFAVPPGAVAANMEAKDNETNKRFTVFYRLIGDGGWQDSPALHLSINPLLRSRYTVIQAVNSEGERLPLTKVPPEGEPLIQSGWPFMAEGQMLRIIYSGVKADGQPLNVMIRYAVTTSAEVAANRVLAAIPLAVLQEQGKGRGFDIKVSLNFENSGHPNDIWVEFNYLSLTLV